MSDILFSKALNWTQKRGFSDIKANFGDFERPTTYSKPHEDASYIPDITAQRSGSKCYIEIATKDENSERNISKWKLLSTLTSMRGGKLFLLAPKGHKAFVERVIRDYRINADLVNMATWQ